MRFQRGFNLIEVVLALGLLSFILLSVMGLFLSAGATESFGRAGVEAVNLAERELCRWKVKDFVELETLVGNSETYQLNYKDKDYTVEISATRLSSTITSAEYRMLDLRTSLTWQEKKSLAQDTGQAAVQKSETHFALNTVVTATGAL